MILLFIFYKSSQFNLAIIAKLKITNVLRLPIYNLFMNRQNKNTAYTLSVTIVCMPFLWDKHFLLSCRFQHNMPNVMFNIHLVKILKPTFVKMIIRYHLLHYPHNLFHNSGYLYPYRLHHPRYMPIHCSDRLIEPYIYIP